MDNRKTELSSHREYNETKLTVAIFTVAAFGILTAIDHISPTENTPRPNPHTIISPSR